MLSRTLFHPSVTAWFEEHFPVPTPAQAEAWPLIKCFVRYGGCGPLVAGAPHCRCARWRCHRACRAHAAPPLWRGVLAAHRTGGGVVAAMAGAVARLSQAPGPGGEPGGGG